MNVKEIKATTKLKLPVYFLTLYLFLSFFHPEEIFLGLKSYRLALITSLITLFLSFIYRNSSELRSDRMSNYLIMLFFMLLFLSIVFSNFEYQDNSYYINVIKLLFLYFMVVFIVNDENTLLYLLKVICVFIGINAFISLLAYRYGFHPVSQWRLTSYFGGMGSNSNGFALLLGCLLPINLGYLINRLKYNKNRNLVYILISVIFCLSMIYCLLRTRSRMGILSLFLISMFFIWFLRKSKIAIISVSLLIIISLLNVNEKSWERLRTARFEMETNMATLSKYSSARRNKWRQAYIIAKEHPFIGVGLGKFRSAVTEYDLGENELIVHNAFLEIAAESGLFNSLLFFIIILIPTYKMFRLIQNIVRIDEALGVYLYAIFIGNIVLIFGLIFLSEQFSPIVYLQLAITNAAYAISNKTIKEANMS